MRLLLPLFALTMLLPSHHADAEVFTVESKVQKAVVYPSRSEVTRKVQLDVPAGDHTIVFSNLQRQLFPDTLRIKGTSNKNVILGALSHKIINHKDIADERAAQINASILQLQDQKQLITAEMNALESKKAFYDSLNDKAKEQNKEHLTELKLNADQWVAAADVLVAEYTTINKALVQKQNLIRDIDDQIQKLQNDLNVFRRNIKQSYRVSLPVEVEADATLQLSLSYQLSGARWKPVYDARLNTQSGNIEITQFGSVAQTTGEDWSDVEITLSTAQPQQGAGLPDLPVWRVGTYQQQSRKIGGGAVLHNYSQNLEIVNNRRMEADVNSIPMKVAQQQVATIDTGGVDAEYDIAGVSSIPSDGTESKLLIGPFNADGQMEIHVKPQIASAAYLANRTKLKDESVLLPGVVNLFRDNDFIGTTNFPLLRPGQEHVLYFGVDNRIAVDRQAVEDTSDKARMLWDENVKTHSYITTIENLRNKAVNLVVTESVPVPSNKDIEVELIDDQTTSGYEEDVDNKKGHLVWSQELAANKKTEIKLGWKVSWPKDENINGL